MGGRGASARCERSDAGGLIDRAQRAGPRIDVSDPVNRSRRIKVSVENALRIAELQLQALALADLERRSPELADEIVGGEPDYRPMLLLDRRFRLRRRSCRGRARCAGSDKERKRKS